MSFNYRVILRIIGNISLIMVVAMLPPALVSYIYGEKIAGFGFLKAIILALVLGIIILSLVKPVSNKLKMRDGYLIAALCWFFVSFIGAFPYYFSGVIPSFLDSYFESVSGFTTTGATIIPDFSLLPKSIQFWRSFSHWLGAIGILILAISLLPALGIGGLKIATAEAPGPTIEKMSTRISDSAKMLYLMYFSFTVVELILLMLGGMNLFDSFIHTFGSMGTGGISTYKNGISHFDSVYIEFIVVLFSIIASINFVLYRHLLKGHFKEFFKDKELRVFLAILGTAILLITLNLKLSMPGYTIYESLRHSIFQSTIFMSTGGYSTADYTLWPSFSQMLLFCLMLIGGCSASTCGSLKVIRVIIIFKLIVRGIYKRLHPNAVYSIKIGVKPIAAETVSKVSSFTFVYFTILIVSSLILSLENRDMLTTISAVACSLSNTGVGFGLLGPSNNFSIFSEASRLYLTFVMIAGRLELFTIIMLISPSFWKAK